MKTIPYKTYENLNLTKNGLEDIKSVIRKFNIANSAFYLTVIETGESDWRTQYIATMDNTGNIIDYVESGVLFYTSSTIAIKQYSISSDLRVTVYGLNVTSPLNVDPFNFTSVTAQRTDKVYQIDATGHFTQVQQKFYQPTTYTKAYLEDMTKDIWAGSEVLITQAGSFTMLPGYNYLTSSIINYGSYASFYLVFWPSSTMVVGTSYRVATVSANCRPLVSRTCRLETGGRVWTVTINPNGDVYARIDSGSAIIGSSTPTNDTVVPLATLTYSF